MGIIRFVAGVVKATAGACVGRGIGAVSLTSIFTSSRKAKEELDKSKETLETAERNNEDSGQQLVDAQNTHNTTTKELEDAKNNYKKKKEAYILALKVERLLWGILTGIISCIGALFYYIIKIIIIIIW